jgi:hypothetical protein
MSVLGMRQQSSSDDHFSLRRLVMPIRYRRSNGGHYPGHLRDAFIEAVDAYREWEPGEPEPTIEVEFGYVPDK